MSSYRLVNERVRANAIRAVQEAEIGEGWVVSIEPEAKRRTQRQNRYLWGVVYKTIADNDPGFFGSEGAEAKIRGAGLSMCDVVHEYCKRCFLTPVILPVGGGLFLAPSTTKLSRQDFNLYVEAIRRWAAMELQVFVPDPYQAGYEDLVWRGE